MKTNRAEYFYFVNVRRRAALPLSQPFDGDAVNLWRVAAAAEKVKYLCCSEVNPVIKPFARSLMRIDLYRRPEIDGQYSYLAVPEGRPIPAEATNTDWETVRRDIDLERNDGESTGLEFDDATEQINQKGYAISSVRKLNGIAQIRH